MKEQSPSACNLRFYYGISLLILFIPTGIAIVSRIWVLTAIPIGFCFGFFLQKGDLCGASAFSEVLLLKSWRKLFGLWVCIVVSMLGFALLHGMGWIVLNPKPFLWLNYLIGGILFGVGMVLAGGCVSGCLFKTGTGNLNSMAGLVGIPIGVAMVEYGPLHSSHQWMNQFVLKTTDGAPLTFTSLTGLSYGVLAVMFGLLTVAGIAIMKRTNIRQSAQQDAISMQEQLLHRSVC